ncbi:MAG TPA: hypothetical protein VMU54_21555 [Planctomycetota bacterium]|nr:hypothetical protein [Planctomycetota bacterium]
MGMTGEHASSTAVSIVCPSCGETYESPERVGEILRNSGFCVNLTCLQDLTSEPIDAAARHRRNDTATRRSTDRRAI